MYMVFDTIEEAFNYCREINHPARVLVRQPKDTSWQHATYYKVFPSGRAEKIRFAECGTPLN